MVRKVDLVFPEFNIKVVGTVQDETEPELCEVFWGQLPFRGACVNTLSTGDTFNARCRPPHNAQKAGTQDNPVGRHHGMLCDRKPGDITFTGIDFQVCYGPDITEPLEARGSIVVKVDPEYLDTFYEAGKRVWRNHLGPHGLVTMEIIAKENE